MVVSSLTSFLYGDIGENRLNIWAKIIQQHSHSSEVVPILPSRAKALLRLFAYDGNIDTAL